VPGIKHWRGFPRFRRADSLGSFEDTIQLALRCGTSHSIVDK
jgi:hypothetical protein